LMVLSLLFSVFIVGYQGITAFTQPTTPTTISIVLGGVISMIIYPLPAAVGLTLYNDIRLRKEGGDLDSRLASLDSE
jgi:hypothetical protein